MCTPVDMQKYSRAPVWGSRILIFAIDFIMSIITFSAIIVCDP